MMYNNNVLGQSGTHFFFGTVEDNNDPQKIGRVRVRVFGVHTQDKGLIPTEMLPWASVANPVTSNETSMPDLYPGTVVFGFFLDGDEMQTPFVTGIVPGMNGETSSIAPSALGKALEKKSETILDEPQSAAKPEYPHNRATVTHSGHVIEYDDTPGAERIHFFHKSGSYIEFLPDGTIVTRSRGEIKLVSPGAVSISSTGPASFKSEAAASVSGASGASLAAESGPVSVSSPDAVSISGGGTSMSVAAGAVAVAGGGLASEGPVSGADVTTAQGHSLNAIGEAIDAGGGLSSLSSLASTAATIAGLGVGLSGLAALINSLEDDVANLDSAVNPTADTTPPPAPTGLQVTAGMSFVMVETDEPNFTVGHGYKETNVYAAPWPVNQAKPTLNSSSIVLTFSGKIGTFSVDAGTRLVVWVKWKTKDGIETPIALDDEGIVVETGQDVGRLVDLIRQEILTSDLYEILGQKIGVYELAESVTQNAWATQVEINQRRQEIQEEIANRIGSVLAEAAERKAAIEREQTIRQTAIESIAGNLETITAAVGDAVAAIEIEKQARAEGDKSEAYLREILATRLGEAESEISSEKRVVSDLEKSLSIAIEKLASRMLDAEASIVQERVTRAGETSSFAGELKTFTSTFEESVSKFSTDIATLSTADSAKSSQLTALTAKVNTNEAALTNEISTRASADSALAQQINTLVARVGSAEASITNISTVSASALTSEATQLQQMIAEVSDNLSAAIAVESGVRAEQTGFLSSKYSVRTQLTSGGREVIGGFGLTGLSNESEGPTIEFGVQADKFWVGAPQGSGAAIADKQFFTVVTTATPTVPVGVYMDSAFIRNASITNAMIEDATITNAKIANLSADKITSGFIDADRINVDTITAEKLNVQELSQISGSFGNITSGSFNINSGQAAIDAQGNATFKSIEVLKPDGSVAFSVKPSGSSFSFPTIVTDVPTFIANDSLYIDGNGNLGYGISKTSSDPLNIVDHSVFAAPLNNTLPAGWTPRDSSDTFVIEAPGPKGFNQYVISTVSSDAVVADGGGYQNSPVEVPVEYTLYRVVMPVKRVTTDAVSGFVYFGPGPQLVSPNDRFLAVSNKAVVANPYFMTPSASSFVAGEWYILVAYLLPSHLSAGVATPAGTAQPADAGLYRMSTGEKVSTPVAFIFNSFAYTLGYTLRSFVGSIATGVLGQNFHIGLPFIHEVNGTEPSIASMFQGINLRTIGYSGDVDATRGAPAGTPVGSLQAEDVVSATNNFNDRNDRLSTAVVVPTVATDGTAVDHVLGANGSVDISFEWGFAGNEADIDGFKIFVSSSTSSTAYDFSGSTTELVYMIPADKRAFILYGVDPTKYYTFGVRSYRIVDPDVNATGIIQSVIVKPTIAAENPYRPSASIAFAGDITGTIAGQPVYSSSGNSFVTFEGNGLANFTTTRIGNPTTIATGVGTLITNDADFGICGEYNIIDIIGENVLSKSVTKVVPGRIYKIETKFKIMTLPGDGNIQYNTIVQAMDSSFAAAAGTNAFANTATTFSTVGTINTLVAYVSTASVSGVMNLSTATNMEYFRAGLRINTTETPSPVIRIHSISVQDVTDTYTFGSQTTNYRTNSAPTNNPTFGTITQSQTADGNILVDVNYAYTQGTLPADQIFVYYSMGTAVAGSAPNPTAASPSVATNAASGKIQFTLKPNTEYKFGLQAVRRTESGNVGGTITVSSALTVGGSNFTGTINGTIPASQVNVWDSLTSVPYSKIFNNDDSVALGFNPTFSEWGGAPGNSPNIPTGWALWQNTAGTSIAKETNPSFVRVGNASVKMVSPGGAGANVGIVSTHSSFPAGTWKPGTFLQGCVDIRLEETTASAGITNKPGILVRVGTGSSVGNAPYTDWYIQPGSSQLGQWQRLFWTARTSGPGAIYAGAVPSANAEIRWIAIYLMGAWVSFPGGAYRGTVYFDNIRFMLADSTTDNLNVKLVEGAGGQISLGNAGDGTFVAVTENNKIDVENIGQFLLPLSVTDAYIGNEIKSTVYEPTNLIKDWKNNHPQYWSIANSLANRFLITTTASGLGGFNGTRMVYDGTAGIRTTVARMDKYRVRVQPGKTYDVQAFVSVSAGTGTADISVFLQNNPNIYFGATVLKMDLTGGVSSTTSSTPVRLHGKVTVPNGFDYMFIELNATKASGVEAITTDIYIPFISDMIDPASSYVWGPTQTGGKGWIINKNGQQEVDASRVRGVLSAAEIDVSTIFSNVVSNYRATNAAAEAVFVIPSNLRTGFHDIATNVAVPNDFSPITISGNVTIPAGVTFVSLSVYNWTNGPTNLLFDNITGFGISNTDPWSHNGANPRLTALSSNWDVVEGSQPVVIPGGLKIDNISTGRIPGNFGVLNAAGSTFWSGGLSIQKASTASTVAYGTSRSVIAGSTYTVSGRFGGGSSSTSGLYFRANYGTTASLIAKKYFVQPAMMYKFDASVLDEVEIEVTLEIEALENIPTSTINADKFIDASDLEVFVESEVSGSTVVNPSTGKPYTRSISPMGPSNGSEQMIATIFGNSIPTNPFHIGVGVHKASAELVETYTDSGAAQYRNKQRIRVSAKKTFLVADIISDYEKTLHTNPPMAVLQVWISGNYRLINHLGAFQNVGYSTGSGAGSAFIGGGDITAFLTINRRKAL